MGETQHQKNCIIRWAFRFIGFLFFMLGIYLFFSPIVELLKFIPMFGKGVDWVIWIFAGILAFMLTIAVIAVAWLFYRPLLSLVLFGIIFLLSWLLATAP